MNSTSSTPLHGDTLARLQRGLVMVVAAAAALALWWWWRSGAGLALLVVWLIGTGHAWALGVEMVIAARVNRSDAAPAPTLWNWLHAWWRESTTAPCVFAWRQPFRSHWPQDHEPPATGNAGSTETMGAATVVLIHGFVCNRGFWAPWMRALRARGIRYVSVNLEPVFGSIDDYVALVEAAVSRASVPGAGRPQLVCHSMGGLAARAWLASAAGNRSRVDRVITIGSPHRGTWLANFSRLKNGRQMRPHGPWLDDLQRREYAQAGADAFRGFVCWYTHTDNIVFPASTATLPGADNRHVPGAGHVDLAFHPRVMSESLDMLAFAGSSPSERTAS